VKSHHGRYLTLHQLQAEKGWPHSRQWTGKLVKKRKIPSPKKRPDGGSLNVWDEDEWDAFQATFVSAFPQSAQVALTTTLIEALSTDSIDGVVAAIAQLRVILEHEGATASDVVVSLKARLTASQAAGEATISPDTS